MRLLGAKTLILTCAAGSLVNHMPPGGIALISDHIDKSNTNPLVGPNLDGLGERFMGMDNAWDDSLQRMAMAIAKADNGLQKLVLGTAPQKDKEWQIPAGTYACMKGPTFETPADIRDIKGEGAHLVGMSTVPECIAFHHADFSAQTHNNKKDLRVIGIAAVTNWAAGLAFEEASAHPLSHEHTLDYAKSSAPKVARLIKALVPKLVA